MKGILDCDESLYFEDIQDSEQEITDIVDYDISVSPNDFNLKTLFDFIDSGKFLVFNEIMFGILNELLN